MQGLTLEELGPILGLVVDTLPDDEREVLTALFWERVGERTIARRLGCTRHNVRLIRDRAFARIRTLAKEER